MKKILFLIVVLITALSVTACFRPRRGNNPPTEVTAATQTEALTIPVATVQVADTATTVPTEAPIFTPEAVSTVTQSQPSEAAASSAQLDQTLNDLEALLNNTDTKVDIP